MAQKNDWVLIQRTILEPHERSAALPEETKRVPLMMWTKGWLSADAEIGGTVTVLTRTGRRETGRLIEVNPHYSHGYGDFVPEILEIGDAVRRALFGEDCNG